MRSPSRHIHSQVRATACALCALAAPSFALAQGVTVTTPPGTAPLPEVVVPNEAPPSAEKPKPKPAAKPAGDGAAGTTRPGGDSKSGKAAGGGQSIAVLVNDEPITGYEIQQRQRLMGMGNANIGERAQANFKAIIKSKSTNDRLKAILEKTIKENEGKSREEIIAIFEKRKTEFAKGLQQEAVESARQSVMPGLRKDALEELIDERLKLQEAKRLSVVASEEDVDKIMNSIAEKNKMTAVEFEAYLKKMGADPSVMRQRFKANMSWQEVIRRRLPSTIETSTASSPTRRAAAATPSSCRSSASCCRSRPAWIRKFSPSEWLKARASLSAAAAARRCPPMPPP
jgi:peptidyl-prolyl cis-trans isomerase SurA